MIKTKREPLPAERPSITKTFRLAYTNELGQPDTLKLYFTAGMYDDGRPGEVLVRVDKQGSFASGALDACAIMMSIALQHGVPLSELTEKLRGTKFGPSGFTKDPALPSCTSPFDLLARWLDQKFPPKEGS